MSDRVVVAGDELAAGAYRLLNRLVIPRPIAWVSSLAADGVDNLAPHSFFTVSAVRPDAVVQFTSIGHKDTLRNVRATGEFVVNVAPARLAEQVNDSGTNYPPELSEFDCAGLTRRPSVAVAPPSVAESPAAIECVLAGTREFGEDTVVFGRVVAVTIAAEVFGERGPDARLIDPIARLGGDEWATLGEISSRRRRTWAGDGS